MGISTLKVLLRMGLQARDSFPASLLASRFVFGYLVHEGFVFFFFPSLSLNLWTLHDSSDYYDDDTIYEYILYSIGSARIQ